MDSSRKAEAVSGVQDCGCGQKTSIEDPQASAPVHAIQASCRPVPGLERECRNFARYLSGQEPSPYIVEKYLDFHQKIGLPKATGHFDRFLVSTAARGPFRTRLADSYASVFRRKSILRRKLVVVLALLECAPPTFETLDRVPPGGIAGAVVRLIAGGTGYALALLAGTALFGPVHLWMVIGKR
jgi:hypothetical protein